MIFFFTEQNIVQAPEDKVTEMHKFKTINPAQLGYPFTLCSGIPVPDHSNAYHQVVPLI